MQADHSLIQLPRADLGSTVPLRKEITADDYRFRRPLLEPLSESLPPLTVASAAPLPVKEPFVEVLWRTAIFFLPEDLPMRISPELKAELKTALKLSGFITFLVIGLLFAQYVEHALSEAPKRDVATMGSSSAEHPAR